MYTAREAREKAMVNLSPEKSEMRLIEKKVTEAVDRGMFSISCDGLLDRTKLELENIGYTVTVGVQYNKPYCIISW